MTPSIHTFQEKSVAQFDFVATVQAHGWLVLRPFVWAEATGILSRTQQLAGGNVVKIAMQASESQADTVGVSVESADPLTAAETAEVRAMVRRMLRLDEDLSEFYKRIGQMNNWPLKVQLGGGRLLRCPTLFEDIIYTLCTTNIAWSGTIRMVDRLTTALGQSFPSQVDDLAFPAPQAIAEAGPELLKEQTGLGYRSPYVWKLATSVGEGNLDLTTFENPELSTAELNKQLRQIKGVGAYAAATIVMILGRYEYLAIDSELRSLVSKKYLNGARPTDAQIQQIYEPWGKWRYLAYWFDPES